MKKWQQTHPDLFKKKVYKQAEPDTYFIASRGVL